MTNFQDPIMSPRNVAMLQKNFKRMGIPESEWGTSQANFESYANWLAEVESTNDPKASRGADLDVAQGLYQYQLDTTKTDRNRLSGPTLGYDQEFIDSIGDDPTKWTREQSDAMMIAGHFVEPGTDARIRPVLMSKDKTSDEFRSSIQHSYLKNHMRDEDQYKEDLTQKNLDRAWGVMTDPNDPKSFTGVDKTTVPNEQIDEGDVSLKQSLIDAHGMSEEEAEAWIQANPEAVQQEAVGPLSQAILDTSTPVTEEPGEVNILGDISDPETMEKAYEVIRDMTKYSADNEVVNQVLSTLVDPDTPLTPENSSMWAPWLTPTAKGRMIGAIEASQNPPEETYDTWRIVKTDPNFQDHVLSNNRVQNLQDYITKLTHGSPEANFNLVAAELYIDLGKLIGRNSVEALISQPEFLKYAGSVRGLKEISDAMQIHLEFNGRNFETEPLLQGDLDKFKFPEMRGQRPSNEIGFTDEQYENFNLLQKGGYNVYQAFYSAGKALMPNFLEPEKQLDRSIAPIGDMVGTMAGFMIGMKGIDKFLKFKLPAFGQLNQWGRNFINGALMDMYYSSAEEGNMSRMIKEEFPDSAAANNFLVEWLATDINSSKWEAMTKEAIEGGIIGESLGMMFMIAKWGTGGTRRGINKIIKKAGDTQVWQGMKQRVINLDIMGEIESAWGSKNWKNKMIRGDDDWKGPRGPRIGMTIQAMPDPGDIDPKKMFKRIQELEAKDKLTHRERLELDFLKPEYENHPDIVFLKSLEEDMKQIEISDAADEFNKDVDRIAKRVSSEDWSREDIEKWVKWDNERLALEADLDDAIDLDVEGEMDSAAAALAKHHDIQPANPYDTTIPTVRDLNTDLGTHSELNNRIEGEVEKYKAEMVRHDVDIQISRLKQLRDEYNKEWTDKQIREHVEQSQLKLIYAVQVDELLNAEDVDVKAIKDIKDKFLDVSQRELDNPVWKATTTPPALEQAFELLDELERLDIDEFIDIHTNPLRRVQELTQAEEDWYYNTLFGDLRDKFDEMDVSNAEIGVYLRYLARKAKLDDLAMKWYKEGLPNSDERVGKLAQLFDDLEAEHGDKWKPDDSYLTPQQLDDMYNEIPEIEDLDTLFNKPAYVSEEELVEEAAKISKRSFDNIEKHAKDNQAMVELKEMDTPEYLMHITWAQTARLLWKAASDANYKGEKELSKKLMERLYDFIDSDMSRNIDQSWKDAEINRLMDMEVNRRTDMEGAPDFMGDKEGGFLNLFKGRSWRGAKGRLPKFGRAAEEGEAPKDNFMDPNDEFSDDALVQASNEAEGTGAPTILEPGSVKGGEPPVTPFKQGPWDELPDDAKYEKFVNALEQYDANPSSIENKVRLEYYYTQLYKSNLEPGSREAHLLNVKDVEGGTQFKDWDKSHRMNSRKQADKILKEFEPILDARTAQRIATGIEEGAEDMVLEVEEALLNRALNRKFDSNLPKNWEELRAYARAGGRNKLVDKFAMAWEIASTVMVSAKLSSFGVLKAAAIGGPMIRGLDKLAERFGRRPVELWRHMKGLETYNYKNKKTPNKLGEATHNAWVVLTGGRAYTGDAMTDAVNLLRGIHSMSAPSTVDAGLLEKSDTALGSGLASGFDETLEMDPAGLSRLGVILNGIESDGVRGPLKVIGAVIELAGKKGLTVIDEFMKTMVYENELNRQFLVQMEGIMRSSFNEAGPAAKKIAELFNQVEDFDEESWAIIAQEMAHVFAVGKPQNFDEMLNILMKLDVELGGKESLMIGSDIKDQVAKRGDAARKAWALLASFTGDVHDKEVIFDRFQTVADGAMEYTRRIALTQDPIEGVGGVIAKLLDVGHTAPGRIAKPFMRTSVNAATVGVEHVPLVNFLLKQERQLLLDLKAGTGSSIDQSRMVGRMMLGTTLIGGVNYLFTPDHEVTKDTGIYVKQEIMPWGPRYSLSIPMTDGFETQKAEHLTNFYVQNKGQVDIEMQRAGFEGNPVDFLDSLLPEIKEAKDGRISLDFERATPLDMIMRASALVGDWASDSKSMTLEEQEKQNMWLSNIIGVFEGVGYLEVVDPLSGVFGDYDGAAEAWFWNSLSQSINLGYGLGRSPGEPFQPDFKVGKEASDAEKAFFNTIAGNLTGLGDPDSLMKRRNVFGHVEPASSRAFGLMKSEVEMGVIDQEFTALGMYKKHPKPTGVVDFDGINLTGFKLITESETHKELLPSPGVNAYEDWQILTGSAGRIVRNPRGTDVVLDSSWKSMTGYLKTKEYKEQKEIYLRQFEKGLEDIPVEQRLRVEAESEEARKKIDKKINKILRQGRETASTRLKEMANLYYSEEKQMFLSELLKVHKQASMEANPNNPNTQPLDAGSFSDMLEGEY